MAQLADLPFKMKGAGAASSDNLVYVAGGNHDIYSTQAVKYDLTSNTWHELDSMLKKRTENPCVFLLGNILCAAGGCSFDNRTCGMECIDVNTKTAKWEKSNQSPEDVFQAACATVQGNVILTGGMSNLGVNVYSVRFWTGQAHWVALAPMQHARSHHCAVGDNANHVYVIGGTFSHRILKSVERYNIQLGLWHSMSPMHSPIKNHACVYINGTIIVTGGFNSRKVIYLYFVKSNRWIRSFTKIPKGVMGHSMAVLKKL